MKNQSPINIDKLTAIPKIYPPIVISGHNETTTKLNLRNMGHTVEIRPSNDSPGAFLSGGPLKETYKFIQLHFHWGSTDAIGSEHSIDGNFYPMEAHFVHYNEKYPDFKTREKKSDGIAVVAVLLQLNGANEHEDNPTISEIVNYLPSVVTTETTTEILPEVLAWVKNHCYHCGEYYTYNGSQTTSPFTENVIWLIYPIPVSISRKQIDLFRQLKNAEGSNITSNHRKTQSLGNRKVYRATNLSEAEKKEEQ